MTGQSATRVHPAVASFATQQWDVQVEDDACLVVLPGPDDPVPRQPLSTSAAGSSSLRDARLIWGDIWLPGRYDRGALSERFEFDRIVQDLEVRRAGRLVYRDRFRWDGPWTADEAEWYFGGALASASLFVAGPVPEVLPEAGPALRRSVFRLDIRRELHPMVRHPAAVTADLVHIAMRLAASWTVGPEAVPGSSPRATSRPTTGFRPRRRPRVRSE